MGEVRHFPHDVVWDFHDKSSSLHAFICWICGYTPFGCVAIRNIKKKCSGFFCLCHDYCIFYQEHAYESTNLTVLFFMQFARVETLSSEYAICTYTGRWERIRSNPKWMRKSHSIFVRYSPWTNVHTLPVSIALLLIYYTCT